MTMQSTHQVLSLSKYKLKQDWPEHSLTLMYHLTFFSWLCALPCYTITDNAYAHLLDTTSVVKFFFSFFLGSLHRFILCGSASPRCWATKKNLLLSNFFSLWKIQKIAEPHTWNWSPSRACNWWLRWLVTLIFFALWSLGST